MKYVIVSAINLAILLVGIAIGVMLAPHIEKTADAHNAEQQSPPAGQTPAGTSSKVQKVQPTMTAGTVGIYLVLAHHIQSDELVVNGIDLMKLHQSEINLLARFVPPQDISKAISDAKVAEQDLYQVAEPATTPSSAPSQPPVPNK